MRRPRRSLPELPHEILAQEILPRLPAKSLRRFKFVCKRWRDLINDPTFIDTHLLYLNHQPTSNQQINVLYTNQGRIYSRIIKLDFLSSIQVLRNPLPWANWFQPRKHVEPSFWGSCNGLVCVRTDDSLGLWNPCTGSYRALDYDPLLGPASHGFGYDANTKDYKLVVISEKQLYMGNVITQVIRVFSLNSNSWRTLSDSVYPCSWMESGMFIDGVVYWVKFEKVICFDIHAEVFSELRLPDISFSELRLRLPEPDISPTHKICKIQISEIGGSLAISYLLNCIFHEVWVMVKENWIKMYSVDVLQNPHWLNDLKPLGGIKVIKRKNEKKENHVVDRVIYMREYSSRSSFSFNLSTNQFTSFPFPNASYVAVCPSLTTYVESLVSVNREKRSS